MRDRLTADPFAELPDVLAAAITDTADQLELTPGESPSATVAIARTHSDQVDLLVLGGTQVALPGEIIRDDRLAALGSSASRKYRECLARGSGYDDEHRALLRELQTEQAKHRNRDGGYWIAESVPEAAHHAITINRPVVDDDTRRAFADAVRELGAVWLSNEAPGVLSGLADRPTGPRERAFVLVRDGSDVLAYTDSHGTWIAWQAAN